MRYFDGTAVIGIRRPGQQSIKIKCVHVGVEYQKNALTALLRRFSGGLGIKPLDNYQINFKRIPVALEEQKTSLESYSWHHANSSASLTVIESKWIMCISFLALTSFPLIAQRNCFPFSLVARWRTSAFSQCPFLFRRSEQWFVCFVLFMRKAKNDVYPRLYI